MTTINISIPEKLKAEAQNLIKSGSYVSFSDLVRDSIRQLLIRNKYDLWTQEAKQDLKTDKAKVLRSAKDMDDYLRSL